MEDESRLRPTPATGSAGGLRPAMTTGRARPKPLRDRAYAAVAWMLAPLERAVRRSSLIPTTPFLEPSTFDWIPNLEANWTVIRHELDTLLEHQQDLPALHEITPDAGDISSGDRTWQSFWFFGYGFRSAGNCARCPETARLLDGIPGLMTAFFSILSPGKQIPPHRGLWPGVVRYHLALKVPDPALQAGIEVAGETRHWQEGRSLVFDDTFQHSAWNLTGGSRVVIFTDVLRPCRFPGSLINRLVIGAVRISPFVIDGRRRHRRWEREYAARHPLPSRS